MALSLQISINDKDGLPAFTVWESSASSKSSRTEEQLAGGPPKINDQVKALRRSPGLNDAWRMLPKRAAVLKPKGPPPLSNAPLHRPVVDAIELSCLPPY